MSVGQEVALLMGEDGSQGATIVRREETVLGIQIRTAIESAYLYAKHNPRSEGAFMEKALSLCTLTEEIASECMFAVPRAGKTLEGPSARFAELIFSVYKNCKVETRIVSETDKEVIATATWLDLENNGWLTADSSRSIVDKHGRKFSEDMIRVTKSAAMSIARRNAVFAGIPKALWIGIWKESRKVAIGDVKTLVNKRADMIAYFAKMGITEAMIFATLEVNGLEDIGLDELANLKAMANTLKEGESTPEEMFVMPEKVTPGKGTSGLKDKIKEKAAPAAEANPAQALLDAAKETLKKAGVEKIPEKKPEPEKKAAEVAPGSTIDKPAEVIPAVVSAVATILRDAKNLTELDHAWRREVEGGTLEKIDKKRLAYVYQECRNKLTG
jgi:hypothetical protein